MQRQTCVQVDCCIHMKDPRENKIIIGAVAQMWDQVSEGWLKLGGISRFLEAQVYG